MSKFTGICFFIAIIGNLLFLHFRQKAWFKIQIRWAVTLCLFIAGLIGLIYRSNKWEDEILGYLFLTTLFIYFMLDRFFKYLSQKKQKRDFYLESNLDFWVNNYPNGASFYEHSFLDKIISAVMYVSLMILLFLMFILSEIW